MSLHHGTLGIELYVGIIKFLFVHQRSIPKFRNSESQDSKDLNEDFYAFAQESGRSIAVRKFPISYVCHPPIGRPKDIYTKLVPSYDDLFSPELQIHFDYGGPVNIYSELITVSWRTAQAMASKIPLLYPQTDFFQTARTAFLNEASKHSEQIITLPSQPSLGLLMKCRRSEKCPIRNKPS